MNQSVRLLTVPEAAKSLGICRTSLYALVGRGELPLVRIGGRSMVDPADLAALVAASKRTAAA